MTLKNRSHFLLILICSVGLGSASAFAQEAAAPAEAQPTAPEIQSTADEGTSSDLMSLNYYPHARKLEIIPGYTSFISDTGDNSNGATSTTTNSQINLNVIYGLGAGWRIGISANDLLNQSTITTNANGVNSDYTTAGISDPTLTGAWRYLDSIDSGLSGDLTLQVKPSFGDKQAAVSGKQQQNGTNVTGGWSETLAANLFWRAGWNELEGEVAVINAGPNTIDGINGNTTTSNTYISEQILIADRYHLGHQWYLQPSIILTPNYQNDAVASSTNIDKTTAYAFVAAPALAAGYRAAKNLVFDLSWTYRYSTSAVTQPNVAEIDNTTNSQNLVLRVQYEF